MEGCTQAWVLMFTSGRWKHFPLPRLVFGWLLVQSALCMHYLSTNTESSPTAHTHTLTRPAERTLSKYLLEGIVEDTYACVCDE